MSELTNRSNTLSSLLAWTFCSLLLAIVLAPEASAEEQTSGFQIIVVSDDIRKAVTATARAGDDSAGGDGGGSDGAGGDSGDEGGKSNNGHGNNEDGVDSSNPGQGGGGPNGATDPSGSYDDESKGGGAYPSKNK